MSTVPEICTTTCAVPSALDPTSTPSSAGELGGTSAPAATRATTNSALARLITNSFNIITVLESHAAATDKIRTTIVAKQQSIGELVSDTKELIGRLDTKLDSFGRLSRGGAVE